MYSGVQGKKRLALVFAVFLAVFSDGIVIAPANAISHAKTLKNLGMNETMFAQGMVPHHQQAIDMSNMALKNSSSPEVKKLAKAIISAQGKEMAQLKYWLTATKSSMTMDHDMGMSGMLPDSAVTALKKLKGSKFDTAFLQSMIAHHEGALEMVSMLDRTKNSEAKKIATDIQKGQSSEITLMKKLLAKSK
jgi:uncharacterized protein (DUF305 family)